MHPMDPVVAVVAVRLAMRRQARPMEVRVLCMALVAAAEV